MPNIMTPGTYLRLRREAAGLSVEDLALHLGCQPPYPAHSRIEWLRMIEANVAPLSWSTAHALRQVEELRFSMDVLAALIAIHEGETAVMPQLCRECGCSWYDACLHDHGGCAWVEGDPTLCSACAVGRVLAA